MPEIDVLVVVCPEHRDDRLDRRLVTDAAKGLGREESHAWTRVAQHGLKRTRRTSITDIADELRRLRANLRIAIGEQVRHRRDLPRVLSGELADTPDAVNACELVVRLACSCNQFTGRIAID